MADLKLIKTSDISKVAIKANQLIFVDDGSMYFDFSNTLRLHNSGGAHLENFIAGKEYLKYDMCVYRGLVYRATQDCQDATFIKSHWQLLSSGGSGEGASDSSNVAYDSTETGLSATNVQQAIDELVILHNVNVKSINDLSKQQQLTEIEIENLAEDQLDLKSEQEGLQQTVETLSQNALTTDTQFVLDTF